MENFGTYVTSKEHKAHFKIAPAVSLIFRAILSLGLSINNTI
jgi:hypothetical protein